MSQLSSHGEAGRMMDLQFQMCLISRCAGLGSVLVVFTCLLVYFCSSQVNISFIEQALCSVSDL